MPDGVQVFRLGDGWNRSRAAILRRAEKEVGSVGLVAVQVVVDVITYGHLGMCKALENFLVRFRHFRFNVVEQKRKMFYREIASIKLKFILRQTIQLTAPELRHLIQLSFKRRCVFNGTVSDVKTRTQCIIKVDSGRLCC